MALRVKQRDTRTETVRGTIRQNGVEEEFSFDMEFRNIPRDQVDQQLEELKGLSDVELVEKMATNWWEVEDEDGEMEFSADNIARVMLDPDYGPAVVRTFWTDVLGLRALQKN